jgi:hypothetical protein
MVRALLPLLAALTMLSPGPAASAAEPRRLTWDELHRLVGKRVSIPLYDGCAVSGKVREIRPDALMIDVTKTSHPRACPTGSLRVPRATLYVLDLHRNGIRYRVTDTTHDVLGAVGVAGKPSGKSTTTIHIIP